MKYVILYFFLIISSFAFAQVAIIRDADGFSNVRNDRSSTSKVLYELKTDVVFFYSEEYYDKSVEWVKVFIPKNKFSFDCPSKYLEGFIHKSRINPLEELKPYNGIDFKFKLVDKPFNSKDKIIDYVDDVYVFSINGLHPFGIDGNKPNLEIDKIDISLNNTKISVSPALIMDLFECKDNSKIYKVDRNFIVHLTCSDGAGYYELVWVVNEKGIMQRLVGSVY
jgi:hypothetical protein